ncbi:uncharacterized protein KY384_003495 [Bacidia gigantensis]|uniref:uncharacterized protein n=1 Tax=Bacidia gigantensis TaxID=2732470 RepID=UPI001D048063|nr:uncharacterized protein KY384_003495 [Bacidia gigantensis]KAG8531859.1 hypothetical protein KY384_003495 [Bacidia gigantensis]
MEQATECFICQEPFDTGSQPETRVILGKCGHQFGSVCLAKWLHVPGREHGCPICREQLFKARSPPTPPQLEVPLEETLGDIQPPLMYFEGNHFATPQGHALRQSRAARIAELEREHAELRVLAPEDFASDDDSDIPDLVSIAPSTTGADDGSAADLAEDRQPQQPLADAVNTLVDQMQVAEGSSSQTRPGVDGFNEGGSGTTTTTPTTSRPQAGLVQRLRETQQRRQAGIASAVPPPLPLNPSATSFEPSAPSPHGRQRQTPDLDMYRLSEESSRRLDDTLRHPPHRPQWFFVRLGGLGESLPGGHPAAPHSMEYPHERARKHVMASRLYNTRNKLFKPTDINRNSIDMLSTHLGITRAGVEEYLRLNVQERLDRWRTFSTEHFPQSPTPGNPTHIPGLSTIPRHIPRRERPYVEVHRDLSETERSQQDAVRRLDIARYGLRQLIYPPRRGDGTRDMLGQDVVMKAITLSQDLRELRDTIQPSTQTQYGTDNEYPRMTRHWFEEQQRRERTRARQGGETSRAQTNGRTRRGAVSNPVNLTLNSSSGGINQTTNGSSQAATPIFTRPTNTLFPPRQGGDGSSPAAIPGSAATAGAFFPTLTSHGGVESEGWPGSRLRRTPPPELDRISTEPNWTSARLRSSREIPPMQADQTAVEMTTPEDRLRELNAITESWNRPVPIPGREADLIMPEASFLSDMYPPTRHYTPFQGPSVHNASDMRASGGGIDFKTACLRCGHTFGSVCIARWLHVPNRRNGCPMCRNRFFKQTPRTDRLDNVAREIERIEEPLRMIEQRGAQAQTDAMHRAAMRMYEAERDELRARTLQAGPDPDIEYASHRGHREFDTDILSEGTDGAGQFRRRRGAIAGFEHFRGVEQAMPSRGLGTQSTSPAYEELLGRAYPTLRAGGQRNATMEEGVDQKCKPLRGLTRTY